MAANNYTKYDEDFKKSLVSLHQNGKTQTQLCKEYGVSQSALGKWIKQYSTVQVDDGQVLTAKQVKELQKRNAQLEEENLILKKAIAMGRGCGHILGQFYAVNPRLCLYSTGLIYPSDCLIRFVLYHSI